jgi:hypothetical protein
VRPHLFVDETKSRGYLMIVACVMPNDLAQARSEVRKLLLPNQRKLHFTSERDSRRRFITEMMSIGATATVHAAPPNTHELAARQACLRQLAIDAMRRSAEMLVIERDDSTLDHDRRTLFETLGSARNENAVRYEHKRPHEESLLWIPDAIAWCWSKGGVWRERVRHAVTQVVELR